MKNPSPGRWFVLIEMVKLKRKSFPSNFKSSKKIHVTTVDLKTIPSAYTFWNSDQKSGGLSPLNRCVSVEMETSSHVSPPVDVLLHHNISRDALDLNGQVPVGLVKNAWCIYTHKDPYRYLFIIEKQKQNTTRFKKHITYNHIVIV